MKLQLSPLAALNLTLASLFLVVILLVGAVPVHLPSTPAPAAAPSTPAPPATSVAPATSKPATTTTPSSAVGQARSFSYFNCRCAQAR